MRDHGIETNAVFVRSLARALLADQDLADDVEQTTWLAALQRREPKPPPKAWFRIVVLNAVRKLSREKRNRGQREQRAARSEIIDSTERTAIDRETIEHVVKAVFSLPEPYQSVILQRFYRDISLREIAEASGEPLATVRSRMYRGLELLRKRLAALAEEGERGDWRAGLVALVGTEAASVAKATPVLAVGTVGTVALVALLILVLRNPSSDATFPRASEAGELGTSVATGFDAGASTATDIAEFSVEDPTITSAARDDSVAPVPFLEVVLRDSLTKHVLEGVEVARVAGDDASGAEVLGTTDANGTVRAAADHFAMTDRVRFRFAAEHGRGERIEGWDDAVHACDARRVFEAPVYARIAIEAPVAIGEAFESGAVIHARALAIPELDTIPDHVRATVGEESWVVSGFVSSMKRLETTRTMFPEMYHRSLGSLVEHVGEEDLGRLARELEVDVFTRCGLPGTSELLVPYDGEVLVYVGSDSRVPHMERFEIERGGEYAVAPRLEPEPVVSGILRDEDGIGLAGVHVAVSALMVLSATRPAPLVRWCDSRDMWNVDFHTASSGNGIYDRLLISVVTATDADGRFEVDLPFTGEVWIVYCIPGRGSRMISSATKPDESSHIDQVVCPAADRCTMLVVDEHGAPISNAVLHVSLPRAFQGRYPALQANERGVLDVTVLEKGMRYAVTPHASWPVFAYEAGSFVCEHGGTIVVSRSEFETASSSHETEDLDRRK